MNIVFPQISIKSITSSGGLAPQTAHWGRLRPPQTPAEVLISELEKFDFLVSFLFFSIRKRTRFSFLSSLSPLSPLS